MTECVFNHQRSRLNDDVEAASDAIFVLAVVLLFATVSLVEQVLFLLMMAAVVVMSKLEGGGKGEQQPQSGDCESEFWQHDCS